MWKILIFFSIAWLSTADGNDCIPRKFEKGTVCVCNSTYCDSTPVKNADPGTFLWYVSSKSGERMNLKIGKINKNKKGGRTLTINPEKRYQKIKGFGGAFTDSTGINIKTLSKASQKKLLETYFAKEGCRYNLCRVPIGGTDFSTRFYTYDDSPGDLLLRNYSLAFEDLNFKIPFMQRALEINPDLKFYSAAWTPPTWMKTNDRSHGFGFLKTEYYQLYADYLVRFLDEYKNYNLDFWAISTGNEPSNAFLPTIPINTMGWTPGTASIWIQNNLGPSLANSRHNETKILALDDQRFLLPWYIDLMFKNKVAEKYISGIGIHWYWDNLIPASLLDKTHNKFPEKFLLMTESCEGSFPWEKVPVVLGSWRRAESLVLKIFQNLNHWVTGWTDWNLALDKKGGPNWNKNFVDAPIIVNPETDEFFKQPLYYVMQHFSRFVPRGSDRIDLKDNSIFSHSLTSIAFQTPQNETVVLIYNSNENSEKVEVVDPRIGVISLEVSGVSLNTIVYRS